MHNITLHIKLINIQFYLYKKSNNGASYMNQCLSHTNTLALIAGGPFPTGELVNTVKTLFEYDSSDVMTGSLELKYDANNQLI